MILSIPKENKWYYLLLDGNEIPFPDEADYELYGSPYVDHCPNPLHVMKYCLDHKVKLEPMSLELILGRWLNEGHPLDIMVFHGLLAELFQEELI